MKTDGSKVFNPLLFWFLFLAWVSMEIIKRFVLLFVHLQKF